MVILGSSTIFFFKILRDEDNIGLIVTKGFNLDLKENITQTID
jgi:hypothetical protein